MLVVVCERVSLCISVDRAQIREQQRERQKGIKPLVKQQLCTRITLFLYTFMLSHAAPLRRAVTAKFHVLWRA